MTKTTKSVPLPMAPAPKRSGRAGVRWAMKRFLRTDARLPLATAAGALVSVLVALVAAGLLATSLHTTAHPLRALACAPLPAVLGVWIDWSRLTHPSGRTRYWSFTLLFLSGLAGIQATVIAPNCGATLPLLALTPAAPIGAALFVLAGTHALLFLARRGGGLFGFELARGTIDRDDGDRIIVMTGDGVLAIDRSATTDLGPNQTMDLSIGAPCAVLARMRDDVTKAGPFRTEKRSRATSILGVASSLRDLERGVKRRARSWVAYLFLLAVGATAFAWAASYTPDMSRCRGYGWIVKDIYWGI